MASHLARKSRISCFCPLQGRAPRTPRNKKPAPAQARFPAQVQARMSQLGDADGRAVAIRIPDNYAVPKRHCRVGGREKQENSFSSPFAGSRCVGLRNHLRVKNQADRFPVSPLASQPVMETRSKALPLEKKQLPCLLGLVEGPNCRVPFFLSFFFLWSSKRKRKA